MMYRTRRHNILGNWNDFDGLFKEFDRFFAPSRQHCSDSNVKTVDENHATLTLALPGVDPKDIEVQVNENIVTITAESNPQEVDAKLLLDEISRTSTRRSYRVAFRPDPKKVKATSKNGILTVELERAAADKPKKIKVLAA